MVALFFLPKIVVHKEQDGAGRPEKSYWREARGPTRLRAETKFCEFQTELCVTLRPSVLSDFREFKRMASLRTI